MSVQLRVLGPLEAEVGTRAVDLGTPMQSAVLALLLVHGGEIVPVDRMIDELWHGRPPARAIASIQAYVANLRRLLEPDRAPRTPARLLVSAAPGYALRLPRAAVDAWRFEDAVQAAAGATPDQARVLLEQALSWWRGPAYAPYVDEPWATHEVLRLQETRLTAIEALADALLRSGSPTQAASWARQLTSAAPLRETGWRQLALALWSSGRRPEALAALRAQRRLLRQELGLEPGPELRELLQAILENHNRPRRESAAETAPGTVLEAAVGSAVESAVESVTDVEHASQDAAAVVPASRPDPAALPTVATFESTSFIGRRPELAELARCAAHARTDGGIALVSGEAGVGKSAFLGEAARRLAAEGWLIVSGRCPDYAGAPPAWAWVEALRQLAATVRPTEPEAAAALLEGSGAAPGAGEEPEIGRFQLHRAVGRWIRAAAARQPVALILDDVHCADGETLALLEHVSALRPAAVLVLAAYRATEAGGWLADCLARIAPASPLRLELTGLRTAEVAVLLRRAYHGSLTRARVEAVAERTGGNPFYVLECARLLAAEGPAAAEDGVPAGVRAVLRRRFDRTAPQTLEVLRLVAVFGTEAPVQGLVRCAALPAEEVLDSLEDAVAAGLLTEPARGVVRFAHALVRDAVLSDLTKLARCRMHARIAEALRTLTPRDVTALAYHAAQADSAELAPLAHECGLRGADLAGRRYAHDQAADLLTGAAEAFDRLPDEGGDRDARRVELLGRLLRAQVRAGRVHDARQTRQQAVDAALDADRDDLLAAALTGWQVPTPWMNRPYGTLDLRLIEVVEGLLARIGPDPALRCGLLDTLVAEIASSNPERVAEAVAEQLALARASGDPRLLIPALSTAAKWRPHEDFSDEHAQLSAELRPLAEAAGLVPYRLVCEYLDACVAGARNDPAALRRHAEAGMALAARYGMAEHEVVHAATLAMLAHIRGELDEADARYAEAGDRMARRAMVHAEDFRELAVLTVGLTRGDYEALVPVARERYRRFGPVAGDMYAFVLSRAGRRTKARTVQRLPEIPRDKLFVAHATLRADAVAELELVEEAPAAVERLRRYRGQIAGAAAAAHAVRPVAHALGSVYRLLGREAEAQAEFEQAAKVAELWDAKLWAEAAREAQEGTGV